MRLRIEQVLNAAIANGQRGATLGKPAHVKLIKATRPTKRRGERPRQFTAGLGRTYRAARLRCQRRTTRSILVSMGRSLDTDTLNFAQVGLKSTYLPTVREDRDFDFVFQQWDIIHVGR